MDIGPAVCETLGGLAPLVRHLQSVAFDWTLQSKRKKAAKPISAADALRQLCDFERARRARC